MVPTRFVPWVLLAGLLVLAWLTRGILLPFLVGFAVGYLLDPLNDRLESHGVPRGLSAAIITGLFLLIGIGTFVALWPFLERQVAGLISALPDLLSRLAGFMEGGLAILHDELGQRGIEADIKAQLAAFLEQQLSHPSDILAGLFSQGMAFFGFLSLLLISPVVTFFMLRDYDHLIARMDRILPPAHADEIRGTLRDIDRAMAGFVRGQLSVMGVMAVLYATGWTVAGLDYGIVLGLLAGLLAIIPFFGMLFAVVIAVGVGILQGMEPGGLLAVAGVWAVVQVLDGVITPRLVGGHIGLHPLWILFAAFAGGELAGFTGVLLAVPVAAVIAVLVRRAVWQVEAQGAEAAAEEGGGDAARS